MTESAQQIEEIEELTARGVAARQSGDRVSALALFEAAIERDPVGAGAAHRETFATLVGLGLTSRAEEALERALGLGVEFPRADLQRGRLAARQGDAELALRYFTKTIDDSPGVARAYVLAAQQLRKLGRYREALEIASLGLERSGGSEAANLELLEERALGLVGLGLLEEAREIIRRLLPVRKNGGIVRQAALILTARKQFAEALELFEGLEGDAWRHVPNVLAYHRCIQSLRTAKKVFDESQLRAAQDGKAKVLRVSSYVFRGEKPLDTIPSLVDVKLSTKSYIIDDLDTDHPTPRLTRRLLSIVEDDLRLLRWGEIKRVPQVCFQYLVPDCFIHDNCGLDPRRAVVSRTGRIVPELLIDMDSPVMVSRTALCELDGEREPLPRVFVTPFLGWNNLAHIVCHILSTLAIYERLQLTCPIIVPGTVGPLHRDLIRASGVPDEAPLLTASEVRGRLLRLAVCPEPVSGQTLREWCATVVRRTVGEREPSVRDEILYISRTKSTKRPLINENELEDMLRRRWGCRVVHMEDLSLFQQLRLIRQARIIVGPHGAGLTSILFARQTTPLIELLPSRYPNPNYARRAALSKHLYLPIFGATDATSVSDEDNLRWRIDLEKVARVLDATLTANSHEHERPETMATGA